MKSLVLILLLASVTLTGCVIFEEEVNVTENETPPPPPPPPPTPSFSISSPLSGEVIMMSGETADVNLIMSIQNLILRPVGGTKKTGEGHFKVTVDGETDTSSSKVYVMSGLDAGNHTVEVELLHNDGTSYFPKISKTVAFSLEQEAPEEYVPQSHEVKIKDFSYEPEELTVKVSDTVTFTNEGSFPRSATCFIGGVEVFDTDVLAKGQSATITMNQVMECEYYSTTHFAMKGKLKVESNEE